MNLYSKLKQRAASGRPIRVGVIGVGKFATMFLSQIQRTEGLQLRAVCDLDLGRCRKNLETAGFSGEQFSTKGFGSTSNEKVVLTDQIEVLLGADEIDVVIESTGDPVAGTRHALACIHHGVHVVMVNVEADVLVGPYLAKQAAEANVIYSLAYGDQPALIVEQVDCIRTMGFDVVCAGKGTKYLPEYHESTPDTVWNYYGLTQQEASAGGMNSKMFNSFLDGTKSAIEMTAVANATGLRPPSHGLKFPPCSVEELGSLLKPEVDGGILEERGMVEVISSLHRNGSEVERDLRWGVYVVFDAPTDYVRNCFREYGLVTDDSGRYTGLYRPYHLIGLELGVSVASVALRAEPTGVPETFSADVICIAKRDLKPGEVLDGEGGCTVWGRIVPVEKSLEIGAVPIGLATGPKIRQAISKGNVVRWEDVEPAEHDKDIRELRTQMESNYR